LPAKPLYSWKNPPLDFHTRPHERVIEVLARE
jgi:hypothetical protein